MKYITIDTTNTDIFTTEFAAAEEMRYLDDTEFLTEYRRRHLEKYGEDFTI